MVDDVSEQQLSLNAQIAVEHLLSATQVPGLASAVIRNGMLDQTICAGVRDVRSPGLVDENTSFDAASLSKPVFAHVVLQLTDQRRLSLDIPLAHYLPNYVQDERAASITAAHVLSHSAGLPNWRSDDLPLKAHSVPGTRFSYSGEGFLYLQRVVEAITGERLHDLARRLVLEPFGMTRSSFVWDWRFCANCAAPHDDYGRPALGWRFGEGNAAASLVTTAADYARFLLHVLDGSLLQPETARLWTRERIKVRHARPQSLGPAGEDIATGVSWGLGWGLETVEETFFHWGNNGPFRAFTVGSMRSRDAAVVFVNGASGLAVMPELVSALMPGDRPSLVWLDYGRHDSPARRILRAARTRPVAEIWQDIEEASLDHDDRLWIARGLVAAGMDDEASWLRNRIHEAVSGGSEQQ